MNKVYQNPVERNEVIVQEMKVRAREGFEYGERANYFNEIAEKYAISFSNAQQIYYTRVRGNEYEEETEVRIKQRELEMESILKNTLTVNNEDVRVVDYQGKTHIVARDLLLAIGIKSSSSYLNELLMEEDKIITPIPSSHGLARTLIITLDTAIAFLEIVSMQHSSLKIRSCAKAGIPELKNLQFEGFEQEPVSIQQLHTPVFYQMGDKIMVRILHIGEKTVETETTDEAKVKGTIYIADVADLYISDLHDFFQKDELVEATVKRFDERTRRLSLTTMENPFMKLRSKYKTSTQNVVMPMKPTTESEQTWQNHSTFGTETVQREQEKEETALPIPAYGTIAPDREVGKILDYLQNVVALPFISEEAKRKLMAMLQHNSLFDLSVAMVKLSTSFTPDVSLLFMEQLEKTLKKEM